MTTELKSVDDEGLTFADILQMMECNGPESLGLAYNVITARKLHITQGDGSFERKVFDFIMGYWRRCLIEDVPPDYSGWCLGRVDTANEIFDYVCHCVGSQLHKSNIGGRRLNMLMEMLSQISEVNLNVAQCLLVTIDDRIGRVRNDRKEVWRIFKPLREKLWQVHTVKSQGGTVRK